MRLQQTPSQTVGPFFHYSLTDQPDQHMLVNDTTKGQRILIKGQVTDGNWGPYCGCYAGNLADASGRFNHPADPNHAQADPNFKGFGRAPTNKDGIYTFKTIKPGRVAYDNSTQQAPHINVRIFARGMLIHLYTRLYFGDELEASALDPILDLPPAERRHTLIAPLEHTGDLPTYCFNVFLQGDNETVFFEP